MAYQPRTYNLESRWDKRFYHLFKIVKILNRLGFKKMYGVNDAIDELINLNKNASSNLH